MIVVLAYVLSFFHRYAPATIAADLQLTFNASSVELGGLAVTYFYVYKLMQISASLPILWGRARWWRCAG